MMFGYADDWTALLYAMVLLWLLFGAFVMIGLGAWCGSAAGRSRVKARIWSVLLPAVMLGVPGYARFKPDDAQPGVGDLHFFLGVQIGLLTALPWLLSWGSARLLAGRRRRREAAEGAGMTPGRPDRPGRSMDDTA